jgi:hypothetical protein
MPFGSTTRFGLSGTPQSYAIYVASFRMKTIQVTFDEKLLDRLDRDEEVQRDGRSAVLRRAAEMYLSYRRRQSIADAYRRAYGSGEDTELSGWSDEST